MEVRSNGKEVRSNGMKVRSNGMKVRSSGTRIRSNGMQVAIRLHFCPECPSIKKTWKKSQISINDHSIMLKGAISTKNKFINNSPHTKEGFALTAKFISPVVPYGHGLDPALQENTAD